MTDENLTTGDPSADAPKFGSTAGGSGEDQNKEPEGVNLNQEDLENIKKQNAHAQAHINKLEEENKTFREELKAMQQELAKSATIDDLMTTYSQPQTDNSPGTTSPQLDEEALLTKLKEEVFQDMSYAQQLAAEQDNWTSVESQLKERHGEGWASYVDQRASELGMTNDQMEGFAKTSPKAFMELVGGQGTRTPAPSQGSQLPPHSDPNARASEFSRIAELRRDLTTEEGRAANRLWQDPDWQKQYRMAVLKDVEENGLSTWR